MQDWPYEVADHTRIQEFTNVLFSDSMSSDVRFTLLDIVLQCAENANLDLATCEIGASLSKYLSHNLDVHRYQVWYWAAFDVDLADAFRISSFCREVWNRNSS